MKKGQIWISVIIYTLVAVLGLVIILNAGIPILTEMKDRAVYSKVKDVMLDLDRHITEIANQGEGSQAVVAFEVRDGEVKFEDGQLIWELETTGDIISPRTSSTMGNLIIASNANVRTFENEYYILNTSIKDDSFAAYFYKQGSPDSWVYYNTSLILKQISYNGNLMDGDFVFTLNDNITSARGTGYTEMLPSGNQSNLGRAKVVAHINSTFAVYDLEFTLDSYADFISVKVKNIQPK